MRAAQPGTTTAIRSSGSQRVWRNQVLQVTRVPIWKNTWGTPKGRHGPTASGLPVVAVALGSPMILELIIHQQVQQTSHVKVGKVDWCGSC